MRMYGNSSSKIDFKNADISFTVYVHILAQWLLFFKV